MPTKRKPFVLEYDTPTQDSATGPARLELSVRKQRALLRFSKLRNKYANARLVGPRGERVA